MIQYFAGLFDGEGCVLITKGHEYGAKSRFHLLVQVKMTDPRPIKLLFDSYNGCLFVEKKKNPKHRSTMMWRASGDKALVFLKDILPFAIVKKDEIELAILYQEMRETLSIDECENLRVMLSELKRRKHLDG